MRALSFSQPWLWAVLYAGKRVENRSWACPIDMIGQTIALHAAKSWDKNKSYTTGLGEIATPIGFLIQLGLDPPGRIDLYAQSSFVGTAVIDYVRTEAKGFPEDQRKWFFGPFGWALTNVRLLPTPIPAGGKLGLWTVAAADEVQIRRQMEAA